MTIFRDKSSKLKLLVHFAIWGHSFSTTFFCKTAIYKLNVMQGEKCFCYLFGIRNMYPMKKINIYQQRNVFMAP